MIGRLGLAQTRIAKVLFAIDNIEFRLVVPYEEAIDGLISAFIVLVRFFEMNQQEPLGQLFGNGLRHHAVIYPKPPGHQPWQGFPILKNALDGLIFG